jgi:hypothetical protein
MLYKLTTPKGLTTNETVWGANITHTASGAGRELCTADVIHAYTSPLLAMLLNPIHANICEPLLWEAEGEIVVKDWGNVGCKTLTTLRRIDPPVFSDTQRAAFAILAAKEVCKDTAWNEWADAWLTGKDRSVEAPEPEADAAWPAAVQAAEAAEWAAEAAAWAAATEAAWETARAAARSAAWVAEKAEAWAAARAAAWVAEKAEAAEAQAAAAAAWAAAWAAAEAAAAAAWAAEVKAIDFHTLAEQARRVKHETQV